MGSGQSNKKPAGQRSGKRVSESQTLGRYAGGAFTESFFLPAGNQPGFCLLVLLPGRGQKAQKQIWPRAKSGQKKGFNRFRCSFCDFIQEYFQGRRTQIPVLAPSSHNATNHNNNNPYPLAAAAAAAAAAVNVDSRHPPSMNMNR